MSFEDEDRHEAFLHSRREFLRKSLAVASATTALPLLSPLRAAAAATQRVTITLWSPAGQRFGKANAGIIPLFERAHPNIKVNTVTTSIGEYFPKMATEIGGGSTTYDLFQAIPTFVVAFASGRKIVPLDDYLTAQEKADLDADIPKKYYDTFKFEGKIYGVPNDSNTQWSFYRKDLFRQAGVQLPKAWDDVEGVVKALQKTGQKDGTFAYTASLRRGEYAGAHFSTIFWSHGGEWWDAGFRPTINNDIGKKTLEIMLSLMPYADPGSINATEDDTINAMGSGTAAYAPVLWGNSVLTNPSLAKRGAQIGTSVPPRGGSRLASPMLGGLAYMIPVGAKNKDAAARYIKFATSRQIMRAWVKNTGQPARVSALRDPENLKTGPYFPTLAQALQQGHPQVRIAESFQLLDALGNQVARALTKEVTVAQALQDIDATFTETLKKGGHLK